jgi:hypothetical protein
MRAGRLVDHREGAGGQQILAGHGGQQHVITGPQSAAAAQRSRDHDVGPAGTVTMPPGSRRAIITPASAVRVSRSPLRQPSAVMVTRSATRPEASMRPNP